MKEILNPPANVHRTQYSTKRTISNPDHPLNRKNTYDPNDPDEICRKELRRGLNAAYFRHLDRVWGGRENWECKV